MDRRREPGCKSSPDRLDVLAERDQRNQLQPVVVNAHLVEARLDVNGLTSGTYVALLAVWLNPKFYLRDPSVTLRCSHPADVRLDLRDQSSTRCE
jgi:hypothetical protein